MCGSTCRSQKTCRVVQTPWWYAEFRVYTSHVTVYTELVWHLYFFPLGIYCSYLVKYKNVNAIIPNNSRDKWFIPSLKSSWGSSHSFRKKCLEGFYTHYNDAGSSACVLLNAKLQIYVGRRHLQMPHVQIVIFLAD